ncbi:hypothetical protein [Paraburkholderia domus]|uniref:hypothetical protein n=1 Tax=Paraburkholderia domus TaxID=2793075 RepID=UPI001913C34A|nr:hypothetical protein [Paraburkholderia domus]MBK5170009.1 hypothetical protein [Burkholderia sp. R-70211]
MSSQILQGEAINALSTLSKLSQVCESWWAIEIAVHINKELLNNDTKAYIKQLAENYPNLNVSHIVRNLLLLSESNSAILYVDGICERLKEYKSSGIVDAIARGAIESSNLLPLYLDPERTPDLNHLLDYCSYSLFDQYILFRNTLFEQLGKNIAHDSELVKQARDLASAIGDWELLNVLNPKNDVDEWVANVVLRYTEGDYNAVLISVADAIRHGNPSMFGMLEIYARAKIYTSSVGSGHTFFDRLSDELARILTLDPQTSQRLAYLEKIAIKFRGESWAKSLAFHTLTIERWDSNAEIVEVARLQTACLGTANTPKARYKEFGLEQIKSLEPAKIPQYRLLRYTPIPPEAGLLNKSDFPIYSDYLRTQSRFLLEHDRIPDACAFCIDEYLTNDVAFRHLPIIELCNSLIACDFSDRDFLVLCLNILDIYAKNANTKLDERRAELFQDFLAISGQHEPSKIFELDEVDTRVAYFLREVCLPNQLDNIIEFESYDDVSHERVAIIDFLIKAGAKDVETLRAEQDRVLETLFAEKLRAKIESGKLYVDVPALQSHRRNVYRSLYEEAKSVEGGVSLNPLSEESSIDSHDLFAFSKESNIAVASSDRSKILVQIFNSAVEDFALDENYGLDKYLSAEVRHIVFVTQLRACFEKTNLVTAQDSGVYLENEFWINKYDYIHRPIIESISQLLAEFSSRIDGILADVNDRFRIKFSDLHAFHVFDFSPYHRRIVKISHIVENSSSFEDFFNSLISAMWELALEGARAAQKLINEVLLAEVMTAIDELEAEIESVKGTIAMVDLMNNLKAARSDFKSGVELVTNWFRFVGVGDEQSYERLGVVMEAAVSSFDSMFKHRGRQLTFIQQKSPTQLTYAKAKCLFISLFTALENALRHGAQDHPVTISHHVANGHDVIEIVNRTAEHVSSPQTFIGEIKAKWNDQYSALSTAEGGSGIYKIFNLLKNSSAGFNFDVDLINSNFICKIGLDNAHFNN